MRKAANHRKRHIPPGPCGIWFQSQLQVSLKDQGGGGSSSTHATGSSSRRKNKRRPHDASSNDNHHPWDQFLSQSQSPASSFPQGGGGGGEASSPSSSLSMATADMSFSPAWCGMLQELHLITPYLPTTMRRPAERYRQLRPHMPPNYGLLWEVQRGHYDHRVLSQNNNTLNNSNTHETAMSLLVLVSTVESHIHHNIWTVGLKDETGVTVTAWVEPQLVQQQLQRPQESSIIRPGVVWRLGQFGMILLEKQQRDDDNDNHECDNECDNQERLERMLLIGGSAIAQVWTPEQQQQKHQQADMDTPRRQREFLDWMERRKAVPLLNNDDTNGNTDESATEDEDEEDGPPDDNQEYDGIDNPIAAAAAAEDLNDPEDEELFESSYSSFRGLATSISSQRSNTGNAAMLHLSSRSATQNLDPSWSRPRLDDAEEILPAAGANGIERHSNKIVPSPTPLTTSTIVIGKQAELAQTISMPRQKDKLENTAPSPACGSQQEEERLVETTEITKEKGDDRSNHCGPSKRRMSSMTNAWKVVVPSENSSFWNSMLDDDDDVSDDDSKVVKEHSPQEIQQAKPNEMPAPVLFPNETVLEKESDDEGSEVDFVTKTTESTSMFDACNFGTMELAAFSDDDDDSD